MRFSSVYQKIKQKAGDILFPETVTYRNWYAGERRKEFWVRDFIFNTLKVKKQPIRFYSVFGPREVIDERFRGKKIFYTGENLHPRVRYACLKETECKTRDWILRTQDAYRDHALGSVDLGLGYEQISAGNYCRHPFWMMIAFEPYLNPADIRQILERIENCRNPFSSKDSVIVASHDIFGTRAAICDDLTKVIGIDYAGKWRNSTDILYTRYNDQKKTLLRDYKFNICPENQDAPCYVTEKLFHAFICGCIPIYHGALNDPEPHVINRDSVILWNFDADNTQNIETVSRLAHDEKAYREFISRPKFKPEAAEYVCDMLSDLRGHLEQALR